MFHVAFHIALKYVLNNAKTGIVFQIDIYNKFQVIDHTLVNNTVLQM